VLLGPPADERPWLDRFGSQLGFDAGMRSKLQLAVEAHVGVPFSTFLPESLGPALDLPLLVVHDRGDLEVPWEDGRRIAAAAARATLLTTEGLGHRRILRDPNVVAASVAFIDGTAPSPVHDAGARMSPSTCRQCGGALTETWSALEPLCMRCGLQRELSDRALRWVQPSS
jgi:hypothetical protein